MAFDLEAIKSRVVDFVHGLAGEVGPYVDRLKREFGAVLTQVHTQAVQDEAGDVHVAGAVQTVPTELAEREKTTAGEQAVAEPTEPADEKPAS